MLKKHVFALITLGGVITLSSCRQEVRADSEPAALPIQVRTPAVVDRAECVSASGAVEGSETADVGFLVGGKVARVLVEEGQHVSRGQLLEVAYTVKEVYYGILATKRRHNAVDAQIRAAELRIVETRNAVETGVTLEVKAAEVRSQIAQARHALGQLDDSVDDMTQELADLCGLPVDTKLQLGLPNISVADPTPKQAVQAALAHNPEIEAAAQQVEKARAALRAAHAEYIPEISAFAQHAYQDGAPFSAHNNGVVGLHMTWTIFEFGKRRGQVAERSAELAEAEGTSSSFAIGCGWTWRRQSGNWIGPKRASCLQKNWSPQQRNSGASPAIRLKPAPRIAPSFWIRKLRC